MKLGQTSIVYFFSKFGSSIAGFVATLYIARVLGAETYGIYALALAVFAWLKIGGTIGVSGAITKRVSEGEEPDKYLVAGLGMMAVLFAIPAGAAVVLREPLESYIGASVLSVLLVLLAAELFRSFTAAALKGQQLVHVYAILDPINVTIRSTLQIGVIIVGFGVAGLLAAYAFASAVIGLAALLVISFSLARPTLRHAKSLFDYAKYSWLGNLKSTSFLWVDVTILGFFVSSALVGIYSVTWSVAAILSIFSSGISTTLFPEISNLSAQEDDSEVANLVTEALRYNGLFMIPGLIGAALVGERILLIYGFEFVIGTTILLILVITRILYGYQKQLVNTINAIDRPDIAFRINATFIAANVILNVVLIWQYGWIGAAVATAIAAGITLGYAYLAARQFVAFRIPTRDIAYQCIAALIMGVVVYLVVLFGPPMEDSIIGHMVTVVMVGIGAGVYFVTLFLISTEFRTTASRNLPFEVPFVHN